jgi:hypothetical protein
VQPWIEYFRIEGDLTRTQRNKLLGWLLRKNDERKTPAVAEHPIWVRAPACFLKGMGFDALKDMAPDTSTSKAFDISKDMPFPGWEECKGHYNALRDTRKGHRVWPKNHTAYLLADVRPENLAAYFLTEFRPESLYRSFRDGGINCPGLVLAQKGIIDLIYGGEPKGGKIRNLCEKGPGTDTAGYMNFRGHGERILFREIYVDSLFLQTNDVLEFFRERPHLWERLPAWLQLQLQQVKAQELQQKPSQVVFTVPRELWAERTALGVRDSLRKGRNRFPLPVVAYVLFNWCDTKNKTEIGRLLHPKKGLVDSTYWSYASKLLKEAATLKIVQG